MSGREKAERKRRRSPLAASSRYYPGFFGALFLVALRVAIGWHFLYEGTQKILSTPHGKASALARVLPIPEGPPFSSEGYLRASTGPLASRFRSLIPDADGRDKLDPDKLKDRWSSMSARVADHFGFDAEQRKSADQVVADRGKVADDWFRALDNHQMVQKYLDELAEIEAIESKPNPLESETKNAITERKNADSDRKELMKVVDGWTGLVADSLAAIARPEQVKAEGDYVAPLSTLDYIDLMTMYGLSAVGLCLILGLFTPVAALGGAVFLLNFYLSMPPWPGVPEGITEGHYRYVNKNLIEMIALLALAATPSGLWIGLDALLFGWIGRARARRRVEEEIARNDLERGDRTRDQDRRSFKKR